MSNPPQRSRRSKKASPRLQRPALKEPIPRGPPQPRSRATNTARPACCQRSLPTPAKFTRSRGPLVADEQRDRSLGDPQTPDAGDSERLPCRARIVSGSDKSQLALRDAEDFLSCRRERAAMSGESHADASFGSKPAPSANTTPRISPSHKPISPHMRSTS
jgi:hypothetical protein